MPNTKGKPITVSKYFDAKNAHDLDTCRYLYDIIIFINNTPLQSYCKIQVTVENLLIYQILFQIELVLTYLWILGTE